MSALDHSDLDEDTQASQLLQTMLNPQDASWISNGTRLGQESNSNLTKDSITDSSPSRNSSAVFDLHGLAQTQTQHLDGEIDLSGGSQKENIGAVRDELLMSVQNASYNAPSSPQGTKPKLISVKAVSFQSPRKQLAPPQINPDSPAQRRPTRATTLPSTREEPLKHIASPVSSQDSFSVLDQDPGQQFLATSKQFNVPLSELPKVVVPARTSPFNSHSAESMHASRRYRRSPSPSEGTILVESTPSASGDSQSQQSQLYPEAQPFEIQLDAPMQTSSLPDQREDIAMHSIEDLSQHPIEDCLSDAPSNFYAEQNEDSLASTALEATQPSTQVEDDAAMDVEHVHPFAIGALAPESIAHSGTAESTVPNHSRSLLSMVDPSKRHRYQHLVQHRSPPSTNAITSSGGQPQSHAQPSPSNVRHPHVPLSMPPPAPRQAVVDLVETQPSFEEEALKRPQRRLPGRSNWTNNAPERDGMDIVPDSEPQREVTVKSESRNAGKHSLRSASNPPDALGGKNAQKQESHMEVANALFPVDDDDDDDTPLSVAVSVKGKAYAQLEPKGKVRAIYDLANDEATKSSGFHQQGKKRTVSGRSSRQGIAVVPPLAEPANGRITRASAAISMDRPSRIVRSWQNGVVPSSMPEEDVGLTGVSSRTIVAPPTKSKGRAIPAQACAKPRRTVAVRRNQRRAVSTAEESHLSTSDDELLIKVEDDQDDSTEPADNPDFASSSSRKRKLRAPPAKGAKANPKSFKKVKKVASSTPSIRSVKRLRSVASITRTSDTEPTRVFALWKSDACYYSGTIYMDNYDGTYEVDFDDNSTARVSLDQMRRFDLRIDDEVLIPNLWSSFKVAAVDKLASSHVVGVRIDTAKIQEFNLQQLRLAGKTVSTTWQDRALTRQMITPCIKAEPSKASPAPSGLSMTSRRIGRSHIFEKTAFVVSVSSNDVNWEKDRENIMSRIKNNGGVIVNDWSDVIDMKGTYSEHSNRWTIEKSETVWIGANGIERIFLVADIPSHKPKFLIALALGIPCLHGNWLHDSASAGEEKDWLAYMLNQGYSDGLSTRISQQVDIDWGSSKHHLLDIMDSKVPCKLFSGKSILCVGDMVPKPRGKKLSLVEEKSHEAHNALTRIILAMGADHVEAVSDVVYASAPIHEFDFIVIKKDEDYRPEAGMTAEQTVHWNWVKECLVASRFLPQPQRTAESQDA
ncbi:hypothetical protein H0H87_005999 [Tephrocybe sp. NHM501043]|nr:hypothetical protein H0H87_005999 [Tephrocybe sp. NHM501043]